MFYQKVLNDFLFFFFALFVIASTFSIALAQSALGISLFLFILLILYKKFNPFSKNLKWFYISVALYIFWMLLSALMGRTPLKSVLIIKEEWLFCAVLIGIYILKKESYRNKIILGFGISIALISIYGIIQYFTGAHWFKDDSLLASSKFGYMVRGFFSHRLTFGNYFATASSFIIAYFLFRWRNFVRPEKIFWGCASVLSFIATLSSHSYGPILALLCSLAFIIILSGKRKIIISLTATIIVVLIIIFSTGIKDWIAHKIKSELDINNQASRVYIWDNSLEMTRANPLFGVGQGNFYDVFVENNPGKRVHVHAHNDLINIIAIAGIPGMLFFALIWFSVFRYNISGFISKIADDDKKVFFLASLAGSVTFFISSFTEATFADEEVRQMLMFIWAVGLFGLNLRNNKV